MFGFRDWRAEEWLRTKSTSLLAGVKTQWRGPVQEALVSGMEQGLNPNRVGLELAGRVNPRTGKREGGSIVLGDLEQELVRHVRRCLEDRDHTYFSFDLRDKRFDPSVRRAIKENEDLAGEKITLLVNRFEAKLSKHHADMLARTEMLAALNRSEWLAAKEVIETGAVQECALTRVWDSAGDDHVRPCHRALNGQSLIGLSDCFISPFTGVRMMHPGDTTMGATEVEVYGCRCRVRYVVDWLYGVE
jgi:hypothetical protein